jgi:hypothetical protein
MNQPAIWAACTVCGQSLTRLEIHHAGHSTTRWVHHADSDGSGKRDHAPVLGVSGSVPNTAICDCCAAAPPVEVWLPGPQPARTLPAPSSGAVDSSWTTPWAVCRACSRHVTTGHIDRLVQRWRALSPLPPGMTDRNQLADHQDRIIALLLPFMTSGPRGPYPLHPA